MALARLLAQGLVERDERGLYRLGAAAERDRAAGDLLAPARGAAAPVDRELDAAYGAPAARTASASHAAAQRPGAPVRRLPLPLAPGVALRPDNLAGGVARRGERCAGSASTPWSHGPRVRELDPASEARARDSGTSRPGRAVPLRSPATRSQQRRLRSRSAQIAMVERSASADSVAQLAHDPLLPEAIVTGAERGSLVDAMIDYDAMGRASWADFLAGHGVLPGGAPLRLGRARVRARRSPMSVGNPVVDSLDFPDLDAGAKPNEAWHARLRATRSPSCSAARPAGWLSIATNWGIIAATFAMVAPWPNPFTVCALFPSAGGTRIRLLMIEPRTGRCCATSTGTTGSAPGSAPIRSGGTSSRIVLSPASPCEDGTSEDPDIGLVRPSR